jgi:hypothetical protein
MTRDEAVAALELLGGRRMEGHLREGLPQRVVDRGAAESREDLIDDLIALGLLKLDAPSPQETEQ